VAASSDGLIGSNWSAGVSTSKMLCARAAKTPDCVSVSPVFPPTADAIPRSIASA
jgi:hypothetical protein